MKYSTIAAAILVLSCSSARAEDGLTSFLNSIFNQPTMTQPHKKSFRQSKVENHQGNMLTSFYGRGENLNRFAANGSLFRPMGMTAAHPTFLSALN